jgi:glutamine amidotransferase
VLEQGNVFATQFHPEKSGPVGAKILSNFVQLAGEKR